MGFDPRDPEECEFNENWCPTETKNAIEWAIDQITDDSGSYIEVGCFEGHSAVSTANFIYPKILVCIDPWVPQHYAEYEVEAYRSRDIAQIFRHNIRVGTQFNVEINKMGWEEYFANNKPRISYLYLDGPHASDNVTASLNAIAPLIVPGGVILGDNYDDEAVRSGVYSYFGEDKPHPLNDKVFYWRNDVVQ